MLACSNSKVYSKIDLCWNSRLLDNEISFATSSLLMILCATCKLWKIIISTFLCLYILKFSSKESLKFPRKVQQARVLQPPSAKGTFSLAIDFVMIFPKGHSFLCCCVSQQRYFLKLVSLFAFVDLLFIEFFFFFTIVVVLSHLGCIFKEEDTNITK